MGHRALPEETVGMEEAGKCFSPKRTQVKNVDVFWCEGVMQNARWVRSTKRTQIEGGEDAGKGEMEVISGGMEGGEAKITPHLNPLPKGARRQMR